MTTKKAARTKWGLEPSEMVRIRVDGEWLKVGKDPEWRYVGTVYEDAPGEVGRPSPALTWIENGEVGKVRISVHAANIRAYEMEGTKWKAAVSKDD